MEFNSEFKGLTIMDVICDADESTRIMQAAFFFPLDKNECNNELEKKPSSN